MRQLVAALFLIASFCSLQAVAGAPSCQAVFTSKKANPGKNWTLVKPERFTGQLDAQLLAKLGLVQKGDDLVKVATAQVVGKIKTVDTKYLFEWADEKLHESLVNYGITPEQMAIILETNGQSAGKGFYVSLHPLDSASYGATLSVFRPGRPLVLLTFNEMELDHLKSETTYVKALAEAGIDAIQKGFNYNIRWMAIIRRDALAQKALPFQPEIIETIAISPTSEFRSYFESLLMWQGKIPASVWTSVSPKNILRRYFLGEALSGDDFYRLGAVLDLMPVSRRIEIIEAAFKNGILNQGPAVAEIYISQLFSSPGKDDQQKTKMIELALQYGLLVRDQINSSRFFEKLVSWKTNTAAAVWEALPLSISLRRYVLDEPLSLEDVNALEPFCKKSVIAECQQLQSLQIQLQGMKGRRVSDIVQTLRDLQKLASLPSPDPRNANPQMGPPLWSVKSLPEAKGALQKKYDAILDIYDLKMVSMVGTEYEAHGLSLKEMKKGAERYLDAEKKQNLRDIKTTEQFRQALQDMYGLNVQWRRGSSRMGDSSEAGKDTVEVTPAAKNILMKNPLLKVTDSDKPASSPARVRASVEYWSLASKHTAFLGLLPRPIAFEVDAVTRNLPLNPQDPAIQEAQVKSLEGLMTTLLSVYGYSVPVQGGVGPDSDSQYKFFMAVHPFADGNGRAGRLFYKILEAKQPNYQRSTVGLKLPIYDLDLMSSYLEYRIYNLQGSFLRAWVREATSDKEFVERAKIALTGFFQAQPEVLGQP